VWVKAVGVDIGGTKIAAGIVTEAGEVLGAQSVATPVAAGPEAVLSAVIEQVQSLLRLPEAEDVQAVGIGTAGMVDFASGVIAHANPNLPGWTGMPVGARVHEVVRLPVYVENDVNALAIGENRFGAGRAYRAIVYVAVGTGVGGAIVLNGEIWRGASHGAGEVAYLVAGWDDAGRPIIMEDRTSGPAMEKHYQALTGAAARRDLRLISERAQAGDALARQVIVEGARVLGLVLGPLVAALDPEVLIIGGGVPNIGPLWWDAFEVAFRDSPLPSLAAVQVVPASLQTYAVLVGAAALALNNL
jgi:glucokinase